jgi:hypothetical protein
VTTIPKLEYDVIVIGGGSAGVGAAAGASQAGARTLLIERGPCLGGAATQKNVLTYCGHYTQSDPSMQAVGGVASAVLDQLRKLGGIEAPVRLPAPSGHVVDIIDPEATKLALDRVVAAWGAEVLLHTTLVNAARERDAIASIIVQDDRGPRELSARAFVDASGDGNLAALSSSSVRYGNHGTVQVGTMAVRFAGIRPGADRSPERWREAIRSAKAKGNALLDKEDGLMLPLPISGDIITYFIDAAYDALDGASISRAEIEGRERTWAYLDAIRTIPGYEGCYIVSSGPELGTRESRHINAQYQISERDVVEGARFDDVVALGAWPVEFHQSGGKPTLWKNIRDNKTFDIPLRALKSVDTRNLFAAGRLADGDSGAGSSIRVMGTSFATGQGAGVAAALLAQGGDSVPAVQWELENQGAVINAASLQQAFAIPLRRECEHSDSLRSDQNQQRQLRYS